MIWSLYLKYQIRIIFGMVIFIISVAILTWEQLPAAKQSHVFELPSIEVFDSENKDDRTLSSISFEHYQIKLDWPVRMYSGKKETITLNLEAYGREINPGGAIEPGNIDGEWSDERSDMIYESYNLVAEARIDLPGIEIIPKGEISQPLPLGKSLNFQWRISSDHDGIYPGMFWFYINIVQKQGGAHERRALLAYPIKVTSYSFLGLSRDVLLGISAVLFLASFALWYRIFENIYRMVRAL